MPAQRRTAHTELVIDSPYISDMRRLLGRLPADPLDAAGLLVRAHDEGWDGLDELMRAVRLHRGVAHSKVMTGDPIWDPAVVILMAAERIELVTSLINSTPREPYRLRKAAEGNFADADWVSAWIDTVGQGQQEQMQRRLTALGLSDGFVDEVLGALDPDSAAHLTPAQVDWLNADPERGRLVVSAARNPQGLDIPAVVDAAAWLEERVMTRTSTLLLGVTAAGRASREAYLASAMSAAVDVLAEVPDPQLRAACMYNLECFTDPQLALAEARALSPGDLADGIHRLHVACYKASGYRDIEQITAGVGQALRELQTVKTQHGEFGSFFALEQSVGRATNPLEHARTLRECFEVLVEAVGERTDPILYDLGQSADPVALADAHIALAPQIADLDRMGTAYRWLTSVVTKSPDPPRSAAELLQAAGDLKNSGHTFADLNFPATPTHTPYDMVHVEAALAAPKLASYVVSLLPQLGAAEPGRRTRVIAAPKGPARRGTPGGDPGSSNLGPAL